MKQLKIVVVSNNKEWCERLNEQLPNYESLTVTAIVSDYKDLDVAMSLHTPDVLLVDLDLLKTTEYRYEFISERMICWDPKIPFVMAVGDADHRAINKGKMRFGIDFWNNKTPEAGSVRDVFFILQNVAYSF